MPYLPAPVLAPFLTQEESEMFGVPPANLQVFTPRFLNPTWLISLRIPCLTLLPPKTIFVQLETLTVDELTDVHTLAVFAFPALRKFSTTLTQGCSAVSVALEKLQLASPSLHSVELLHAPSRRESATETLGMLVEERALKIPKHFRHFSVVGCAACSLNPSLVHLLSLSVSVSTKFPKKFPAINPNVEKLHLDFHMVWRPSLEVLAQNLPKLKELTVAGPVFGDAANVLGRLLRKFPGLRRVRLCFRDTQGCPVLGLMKEIEGSKINVENQCW